MWGLQNNVGVAWAGLGVKMTTTGASRCLAPGGVRHTQCPPRRAVERRWGFLSLRQMGTPRLTEAERSVQPHGQGEHPKSDFGPDSAGPPECRFHPASRAGPGLPAAMPACFFQQVVLGGMAFWG